MLMENSRPNSVINILVKGGTPFPYKVAKALDPRMYRNVEFDLWSDEKKGVTLYIYSDNLVLRCKVLRLI